MKKIKRYSTLEEVAVEIRQREDEKSFKTIKKEVADAEEKFGFCVEEFADLKNAIDRENVADILRHGENISVFADAIITKCLRIKTIAKTILE